MNSSKAYELGHNVDRSDTEVKTIQNLKKMATRNLIMVVDRRHARGSSYGLALHPEHVTKYSYVHMYHHHDGLSLIHI